MQVGVWKLSDYTSLQASFITIQYDLDDSNTDKPFIVANSNSLLSPWEILSIAPENKYLYL